MKISTFTHTIKPANEDVLGVTKYGAFVLDGASALVEGKFTPAYNDVVWMVQWWREYLVHHLDKLDLTLHSILEQGVHAFNNAFSHFRDIEQLSPLEKVSATLAIVRENKGELECYVLGDAEVSLKEKSGDVNVVTDIAIRRFDEKVLALMASDVDRDQKCVFKGFTERELSMLRAHRMQMNTEEGYFILSHDAVAIQNGIYHKVPLNHLESYLLSTDGINPLNAFYSRRDLMDACHSRGLESIVNELRAYEKEDLLKTKILRLKSHDDVAVVHGVNE